MDLSKLTPAPWKAGYHEDFYYASAHGDFPLLLPESDDDEGKAAIDFACLARAAFDVMMRRGWTPIPLRRRGGELWWGIRLKDGSDMPLKFATQNDHRGWFIDPFTALVEADKWYRENVELKPPSSP